MTEADPKVTPGLVCAHHHLYSELARGMPAPPRTATTFREILEQVWWRLDTALDLEMIEWSAKLGALEALESGTTAIIDHHESPNAIEGSLSVIARACAEVGVRVVSAYGVTDRHGPDGARLGLEENRRFLSEGGRGLVGIHAAFTCSDATLEAAAALAEEFQVGAHVHVCEGPEDVDAPSRLARYTNGAGSSRTASTFPPTTTSPARSSTTRSRTSTTPWATRTRRVSPTRWHSVPTGSAHT